MNEQEQREQVYGRSFSVWVYAGNVEALELAALDEARKFFGAETRLEVARDYQVIVANDLAADQRYQANVTIREVL